MNAMVEKFSRKLGKAARAHFPIFEGNKVPLHYLDTAASAQKPKVVIDRISNFLSKEHANIHRGAYALSAKATDHYEEVRGKISRFIGAKSERSIIFTKSTTESINLVAHALQNQFREGDSILLSLLEHHSNIVPWQLLASRAGLKIEYAEITDHAELDLENFISKIKTSKPKLVSICHVSNAFGSVMPIQEVINQCRSHGALVMLDAAQSMQHQKIDVQSLDVDFLAFSGHKLYGPTGIGVLYVKPGLEEKLQPFQGGGDMISHVAIEGSRWAEFPQKFEAGTPAIAEAIALGTAIDFISQFDFSDILQYEADLFEAAWDMLSKEPGVTLYGPAVVHGASSGKQVSILPFNVVGVHPHDVSTVADSVNVQIRAGHHCAMPALKRLGLPSSARASIGIYNDIDDFEALIEGIRKARKLFST